MGCRELGSWLVVLLATASRFCLALGALALLVFSFQGYAPVCCSPKKKTKGYLVYVISDHGYLL